MISLYASHEKIYPRSVSGFFSNWRWGMVFLTQLVFYGIPWLEWGQRQAVLFDLGARRFYIFGLGAVSARFHLPHWYSGHLCAVAVFVYSSSRAIVVRLCLSANCLH